MPIRGAIISPEGDARAVLQIAHGMAEHKERYYNFMEYLAARGIASVINDHRGHGASVRSRDDLGYFGVNGDSALVADMRAATDIAKREFPNKPLFLLGHSMGALAARIYVQTHARELSGLIITGNPGENGAAGVGLRLARSKSRRGAGRTRSALMSTMMFTPFMLGAPSLKTRNAWICADKNVVREYDNDPLCGFTLTVNGYEALLSMLINANKAHASPNPDMPALFLSGAKDPCMGGAKKLEKAAGLLRAAGCEHVKTRLYTGMRHEILNEIDKEKVYADIAETLESWLSANARRTDA